MWVQLIQFQLPNAILDEHLRTPVLLTPFRLGSITAISTQGNEGRETETERGEEAEGRQLRAAARATSDVSKESRTSRTAGSAARPFAEVDDLQRRLSDPSFCPVTRMFAFLRVRRFSVQVFVGASSRLYLRVPSGCVYILPFYQQQAYHPYIDV